MKEMFYRHFWKGWGLLRSKENDLEYDCPCCGLDLPWPQAANFSPEKVTPQTQNSQISYRLEGTRTCPRCCHQWSAVIETNTVGNYAVGASCKLPTYGSTPVWSSPATT